MTQFNQPLDSNVTFVPCAVFDNAGTWKRWTSTEIVDPTHICGAITGTNLGTIYSSGESLANISAKTKTISVKFCPNNIETALSTLETVSDADSEVQASLSGEGVNNYNIDYIDDYDTLLKSKILSQLEKKT